MISPVPHAIVSEYRLDTRWYSKFVDVDGLPILGSAAVSDQALLTASGDLSALLQTRDDSPVRALRRNKIRVVILARGEKMSAIPEVRKAFGTTLDERYWGGMGATSSLPATVGTEANILDNQGEENVLIHEFGHTLMDFGLSAIDPKFTPELQAAWDSASAKGLWRNTYAGSNIIEYWAEGLQAYFNVNREGPAGGDGVHNEHNTRDELATHDDRLYELLQRIYGSRAGLPPRPDYTMAVCPLAISLVPGGRATATLTIADTNGFAQPVDLSSRNAGNVSGLTTTFSRPSWDGEGSVTVTFSAESDAAPGHYIVYLQGRSSRHNRAVVTVTISSPRARERLQRRTGSAILRFRAMLKSALQAGSLRIVVPVRLQSQNVPVPQACAEEWRQRRPDPRRFVALCRNPRYRREVCALLSEFASTSQNLLAPQPRICKLVEIPIRRPVN